MEQRRQTKKDVLNMRSFFAEGDLICGVIYRAPPEGRATIHLSEKLPQKLEYGTAVRVPCTLIKDLAEHVRHFDFDIDCILGRNGWVWIAPGPALLVGGRPIPESFARVARTRALIEALHGRSCKISPEAVSALYRAALPYPLDQLATEPVRRAIFDDAGPPGANSVRLFAADMLSTMT
eukprot:EC835278.1.p1 GENE.EC835278.1~~EC835278.1.p1  ORF type:complete len:179 (+),score=55.40 EC835278.1:3-539(+)